MSSKNPIIAPWPVGARGGLIDEKHRQAMGEAVFLFMWCLLRQTSQKDGWGIVLYGNLITYDFIHAETGFPIRTLERWMRTLVDTKYLRVERLHRGQIIWIAKAKKWFGDTSKTPSGKTVQNPVEKPHEHPFYRQNDPPSTADHEPPKVADHGTKSGGSFATQVPQNQSDKCPSNSTSLKLLNSTKLRHDAGASGAPTFSSLIKSTELPGGKPPSSKQIDGRRRLLLAQADKIKRDYPSARTA